MFLGLVPITFFIGCGRTIPERPSPTVEDVRAALASFDQDKLSLTTVTLQGARQRKLVNGQWFTRELAVAQVSAKLECKASFVVRDRAALEAASRTKGWNIAASARGLDELALLGPGECQSGEAREANVDLVFEWVDQHWRLLGIERKANL
jgi:hypothetical protein